MYGEKLEDKVVKYLPLVEKVVNRISIKNSEYEYGDLYDTGVIGLIDALQKFDNNKKVPFESYAKIRIKGAIIDEVRQHAKLSRYKMARINNYYQVKQNLDQKLKREATDQEITQAMNISIAQLNEIYEGIHYLASISLESTIFPQSDSFSLEDVLEDSKAQNGERKLLYQEKKDALVLAIKRLSQREQLVLSLYYQQGATLKEISKILDISVARVSQIHGKIIIKLRDLIEEEMK
ncbi:FliA/WhiG family RNA polymerase sigma factor [Liquorilactobacillus sicerae]|uniref:FliA/WhiG family RNA polymerase sigma factor n=1 Tax=Liquorilactobacillus sicerae TaxID=1416943 RepID=UPI00247FA79B|nr:FliA/WhiG family RNA polymerase sigma factor [Liquorilactobacillus sicerae]